MKDSMANATLKFTTIVALLVIVGMIVSPTTASAAKKRVSWQTVDGFYAETFMVTKRTNHRMWLTTQTGNVFLVKVHTDDDYEVGDLVSCIMDSKGTIKVKDDVILSMKYSGWVEKPSKWIKR